MVDELTARRQDLRDAVWRHGPEHFDMAHWGKRADDELGLSFWRVTQFWSTETLAECGTTCCLAGHGAILMRGSAGTSDTVAAHFGLPLSAFYVTSWWDVVTLSTGESLAEVQHRTGSEWETVLAYLDDLIKGGTA